jgi:hypothetical protein
MTFDAEAIIGRRQRGIAEFVDVGGREDSLRILAHDVAAAAGCGDHLARAIHDDGSAALPDLER